MNSYLMMFKKNPKGSNVYRGNLYMLCDPIGVEYHSKELVL